MQAEKGTRNDDSVGSFARRPEGDILTVSPSPDVSYPPFVSLWVCVHQSVYIDPCVHVNIVQSEDENTYESKRSKNDIVILIRSSANSDYKMRSEILKRIFEGGNFLGINISRDYSKKINILSRELL